MWLARRRAPPAQGRPRGPGRNVTRPGEWTGNGVLAARREMRMRCSSLLDVRQRRLSNCPAPLSWAAVVESLCWQPDISLVSMAGVTPIHPELAIGPLAAERQEC